MGDYLRLTRSRTFGYLAALPLLLAYEVLIVLGNQGSNDPIHVGAYIYTMRSMHALLAALGVAGNLWVGAVLLLVGLAAMVADGGLTVRPKLWHFPLLILECLAWAGVSAVAVGQVVHLLLTAPILGTLALADAPLAGIPLALRLALSLGAGLYEELVFRVIIYGLMAAGLKHAWPRQPGWAVGVAAVVGALIFSGVHYLPPLGDPLELGSFSYRFLFGLVLTALFEYRGFAVAAWTHALYDVIVLVFLHP